MKHYGNCNDLAVGISYWESVSFLIDLHLNDMQGRKWLVLAIGYSEYMYT